MSCDWASPVTAETPVWDDVSYLPTNHRHVVQEDISGSGTTFETAEHQVQAQNGLSSLEAYFLTVVRLIQVTATPASGEYVASGVNLETGDSKGVNDVLNVDYVVDDCEATPHTHIYNEEIDFGSGTEGTLTYDPVEGSERLFRGNSSLRRVASSPATLEYSISGKVITLGLASPGTRFFVDYEPEALPMPFHEHVYHEDLAGTGQSFTLANTPEEGTVRLYLNGARQIPVDSNPNSGEYSIEGSTVSLGSSKGGGDTLTVDYLVRQ